MEKKSSVRIQNVEFRMTNGGMKTLYKGDALPSEIYADVDFPSWKQLLPKSKMNEIDTVVELELK